MERIENPEVKQYLEKFVITTLSNCELFTKTFGKNFAEKRLKLNLDKVYTNETSRKFGGYQRSDDSSITLCTNKENSKLLSPTDIENDDSIKATTLHEAIHAILTKTKLKCKLIGIKGSTGILEHYANGTELGRGANEGLTNWICNKAGLFTSSYKTLTNFIHELELAIGEERVMKLGKGNISRNVAKQLKMKPQECRAFLGLADEIYSLQDSVNDLNYIIDTIVKYQDIDKFSEEEKNIIKENHAKLSKMRIFKHIIMLNNINPKDDKEILNQKAIFEKELKERKSIITQCKSEFESKIFVKYFQSEFEELMQMENNPPNQLAKFNKLNELLSEEEVLENSVVGQFKQNYKIVKERYFENICSQAKELFEKGELSGSKIEQLEDLSKPNLNDTKEINVEFFDKIAQIICPTEVSSVSTLLSGLAINGELNTVNQYSILRLAARDVEIDAYLKNGKVVATSNDILHGKNEEEIDENNVKLDFTIQMNEDYHAIVNQFLELKNKVQAKNPDASIKILDRLIVIENNNEQSIYIISNGQILPAINKKPEPIILNLAPNEVDYPSIYKENKFTKASMKLKKRLLRNTDMDTIYHVEKENDSINDFKKRISDMSQYSDNTNTQSETEQKTGKIEVSRDSEIIQ